MVKREKHIKPGYQLTEVGIIPVEWELKSYGDIFSFLATAQYSREALSSNKEILYLHYGDIHVKYNNRLDVLDASLPSITEDQLKGYSLVRNGDLIMADASEDYDGIGKSIEITGIGKKKMISGLHTFLLRDSKGYLADGFKGYLHENKSIKSQFDRLATGLKVYGVSKNNLKKVIIPVPSKSEQSAIATILSDTDALIVSLDGLIEKKKAIKQGTMQELLTGKRRLPGFSGKWEEKKISETGLVITGSTPPTGIREYWNGNIPWITPTDISDAKDMCTSERSITKSGLAVVRELPENTLLVTCIASIGKNTILRAKGSCNQQINAIIPSSNFDVDFLYYLTENNKNYLLGKAGITATLMISKKDFSEITFRFPNSKSEQSAIAQVLSDMDSEISDLEAKRDKYKSIKQGMMSELLTGNIRLLGIN